MPLHKYVKNLGPFSGTGAQNGTAWQPTWPTRDCSVIAYGGDGTSRFVVEVSPDGSNWIVALDRQGNGLTGLDPSSGYVGTLEIEAPYIRARMTAQASGTVNVYLYRDREGAARF